MKARVKLSFNLILTLALCLVAAQMATAQEAAVYDLVTEVPTVDGGQSTNSGSNYNDTGLRGFEESRNYEALLYFQLQGYIVYSKET